MSTLQTDNLNCKGSIDAEFVVVCDIPSSKLFDEGGVMTKGALKVFREIAHANDMQGKDFFLVTCAPPLPEDCTTDGKIGKFVDSYRPELMQVLDQLGNKKVVIPLGKNAARAVEGKAVKITKITGRVREVPDVGCHVFPLVSPSMVLRRPEVRGQFEAEFNQIPTLREYDWDAERLSADRTEGKYEWVTDIQFLLDMKPKVIAADTETDNLTINALPYLVQVSYTRERAILIPTSEVYYKRWQDEFNKMGIDLWDDDFARIRQQLRRLFRETPTVGHNFKFDYKVLENYGCDDINWYLDTMQLAAAANENMLSKALADCVTVWYPEMSGYSDKFDSEVDKSRMIDVSPRKMMNYAGGDAEVTLELAKRVSKIVKQDKRQWDSLMKVQMPALKMFAKMERTGMLVDKEALRNLEVELDETEAELYKQLIKQVPNSIKERHLEKGLKFTRDEFVRDILFSEDGLNLTPVVFTDGTKNLPDDKKIPSISSKDHLPYFEANPFVRDLIQYSKLQKMRSTYVGFEGKWESRRVKRLKTGGLPKKLTDDLARSGLKYDRKAKQLIPLEGFNYRPRKRARKVMFDGKERSIDYVVSLDSQKRLMIDNRDEPWTQTLSEPTGFWQYLESGDSLYPNYHLHRTVTGRTSSSDPNAQNFPKRGKLAKAFRKVFIAPEGWTMIGVDLSQAELRIAAWMANETNMLRIYNEGGDIHSATAAATMGMKLGNFMDWKGSESKVDARLRKGGFDGKTMGELFDFKRFQAKAVNFGFIYGMGWRGFKAYAKTDYGIDLTDREAQKMREAFFGLYPKLEPWHKHMKQFVREHGYVRALHGALRRLPSIHSDDEGVQSMAERQAVNSPVQRFASDLGLMGLSDFFSEGYPEEDVKPLAFIHDAGYLLARDEVAHEMAAGLKWCMENVQLTEMFGITPPLPICADTEIGQSMGTLEEVNLESVIPHWLAP